MYMAQSLAEGSLAKLTCLRRPTMLRSRKSTSELHRTFTLLFIRTATLILNLTGIVGVVDLY